MAGLFKREESEESLPPRRESNSYCSSEENTDSGLVPTPDNTSDTSIPTSDSSSGMESIDLRSSVGSSEVVAPTEKSLLSKAKDLASRVARSFSPNKDTVTKDDGTSFEETADVNEKTTPKKSLIQKCLDKIFSPKKTCNLDASKSCESPVAPTASPVEQRKSRFSGITNLRLNREKDGQDKSEERGD